MGDHTEAIQIEFDPKQITYAQLLEIFWESHDPYGRAWSTQYKAVLWTHDDEQQRIAQNSIAALAKKNDGRKPTTELVKAPTFWIAEDYHQKYSLRRHKALVEALLGGDVTDEKIRESTATARANGWVAGRGTAKEIESEAKALGLSEKALIELRQVLGERLPVGCR